ncbi:MAG TPA: hypothetical protein VFU60_13200 [Ktedonobacterales bacterium]|nr:hypothetical protein [Ktedonobacterales bacterium]
MSYQTKVEISVRVMGYALTLGIGMGIGIVAAHGILGWVFALVAILPVAWAMSALMDWLRAVAGV